MKKTPRKTTAGNAKTTQFSAFGRQALLTFERLDPGKQVVVLNILASWQEPQFRPSRLYSTDAQRRAAREMNLAHVRRRQENERLERERVELRRTWNALHNKAQARPRRHQYLTPTEQKRAEAMSARLHAIEYKLGYRWLPTAAGGAR